MSKLKQLIGLQSSNLSVRALARALDLSIGAVSMYLRAVRAAGIGTAEAESLSEVELALRVFGVAAPAKAGYWRRRTARGSTTNSSATGT